MGMIAYVAYADQQEHRASLSQRKDLLKTLDASLHDPEMEERPER